MAVFLIVRRAASFTRGPHRSLPFASISYAIYRLARQRMPASEFGSPLMDRRLLCSPPTRASGSPMCPCFLLNRLKSDNQVVGSDLYPCASWRWRIDTAYCHQADSTLAAGSSHLGEGRKSRPHCNNHSLMAHRFDFTGFIKAIGLVAMAWPPCMWTSYSLQSIYTFASNHFGTFATNEKNAFCIGVG